MVSVLFSVGMYGSMVMAQIYRYRWRSTPLERQQTKWVALALTVVALLSCAWAPILTARANHLVALFAFGSAFQLAVLLIPLAIAAAISRYRLWEVDRLINQALVYGLLTGLLGGVYAGLIIGLHALASHLTGQADQSPLVLVISTLAIAALVLPVRRHIQALIDRRFYRRKYDAQQTLAAFSAALRQEVDLEEVCERLLAAVRERPCSPPMPPSGCARRNDVPQNSLFNAMR